MSLKRTGPKGAVAPFGFAAAIFLVTPSQGAYQDLAALIAQQPAVSERWREHLANSPFGTIHAATFSFHRPIGTFVPESITAVLTGNGNLMELAARARSQHRADNAADRADGFQLASFTSDPVVTGSLGRSYHNDAEEDAPVVNRVKKGDFLGVRKQAPVATQSTEPVPSAAISEAHDAATPMRTRPAAPPIADRESTDTPPVREAALPLAPEPLAPEPIAPELIAPEAIAPQDARATAGPRLEPPPVPNEEPLARAAATPAFPDDLSEKDRTARILFGGPVGARFGVIEPWRPGEEPVLAPAPRAQRAETALTGGTLDFDLPQAEPPGAGHSVAGKGVVTGELNRPMSLAERLGLQGQSRAKAERCLANAIYFESRGESVRGQIAVAQVVMNRVFSGYYPSDVCGVVYQNANRHLACQFTFACDGISDTVTEPDAWSRATNIATGVMDGKYWLSEVGKSTHYHAYWVHPWWTRTMTKISKIGVHTFYRPRKWGDGSEAPAWGDVSAMKSSSDL